MNVRWLLPLIVVSLLPAQRKKAPASPGASRLITEFPVPDVPPIDAMAATKTAIAGILALQEDGSQWPYEGVYREDRGNLPVGYRVGGTSIPITRTSTGLLGPGVKRARGEHVKFSRL